MESTIEQVLCRLCADASPALRDAVLSEVESRLNYMILHRFDALVQLLYRLDVDERKLRGLLHQHPSTDAARLIATLIVERQLQKLRTRQQFKANPDIPEEDRW